VAQYHRFFSLFFFTPDQSHFFEFGYDCRPNAKSTTPGSIQLFNFKFFTKSPSIACYHCGDQVALRDAVVHEFHGAPRDLCCHGCVAVLMMIEANSLTNDYLRDKAITETLTS